MMTLLIGGPGHGRAIAVPDTSHDFVLAEADEPLAVDPVRPAPADTYPGHRYHKYEPRKLALFGRILTLHLHQRTAPNSRQVPYALLSFDGQAVYANGCPGCRDQPAKRPRQILYLEPHNPAVWRDIADLEGCDGRPPARIRTLMVFSRCMRLATPEAPGPLGWLDPACAAALLNFDALALWKAAPCQPL